MKTAEIWRIALAMFAGLAMMATACTNEPDDVGSDDAIAIEDAEAGSPQSTGVGPAPTPSSNAFAAREGEPESELAPSALQPIGEDAAAALAKAATAPLDQVATVSTPTGDWMVIVSPPADITDELVNVTDGVDDPPEGHVIAGIDAMVALIEADTPQIPASALVWQIAGGATGQLYSSDTIDRATACGSQDRSLELSESFAPYDSIHATLCVTIPIEDLAHPDTQVVLHTSTQEYWKFDETAFHTDGVLSGARASDVTDWSGIGPDSPAEITVDDHNDAPVAFVAIYDWEPEERSIADLGCGIDCDEIVATLLHSYEQSYRSGFPYSAVLAEVACNGCASLKLLAVVSDQSAPSGYGFVDRDEFIASITPIDTSFEAMIASGSAGYFRQVDGIWQTIASSLLSDCGPTIRRHSILEIASDGSLRELEAADRYEGTDCDY